MRISHDFEDRLRQIKAVKNSPAEPKPELREAPADKWPEAECIHTTGDGKQLYYLGINKFGAMLYRIYDPALQDEFFTVVVPEAQPMIDVCQQDAARRAADPEFRARRLKIMGAGQATYTPGLTLEDGPGKPNLVEIDAAPTIDDDSTP